MKKTFIALCTAAIIAVPTTSQAAANDYAFKEGHVLYAKWLSFDITKILAKGQEPTTQKKQAEQFVEKKQEQPVEREQAVVKEQPVEREQPVVKEQPAANEQAVEQEEYEQQADKKDEQPPVAQPTTSQTVSEASETSTQNHTTKQSEVEEIEAAVVALTNNEREKAGLAPLQVDTALMAAAREKSQDMKNNNYFSHTSPTFGSPFDRLKALGIHYEAAGENIAKGQRTAEEVVTAWMNSEGHRANILNEKFTHIGVGFVQDGYIWTQQFIKK